MERGATNNDDAWLDDILGKTQPITDDIGARRRPPEGSAAALASEIAHLRRTAHIKSGTPSVVWNA